MKDPWRNLVDYESYDLVKRVSHQLHNRELSAANANEITSLFSQSKEYYRNANNAAFSVKPLLQYYGVLAASRALILLLSPGLSPAALKPAHGLEVKEWQATIAKGLSYLGELEVFIRNGTFLELLKATDNHSPLRANSSRVNWRIGYDLPAAGSAFSLHDLIATMPDLRDEYTRWTGMPPTWGVLESLTVIEEGGASLIRLASPLDADSVKKIFPPSLCGIEMSPGNEFRVPECFTPHFEQSFEGPFGIGDAEIVPLIRAGVYLNTIGKYVALAYILGMLVRYFSSTWISLGRSAPGDSIYPVIIRIIDLIQNRFPQIVLDYIEESLSGKGV